MVSFIQEVKSEAKFRIGVRLFELLKKSKNEKVLERNYFWIKQIRIFPNQYDGQIELIIFCVHILL